MEVPAVAGAVQEGVTPRTAKYGEAKRGWSIEGVEPCPNCALPSQLLRCGLGTKTRSVACHPWTGAATDDVVVGSLRLVLGILGPAYLRNDSFFDGRLQAACLAASAPFNIADRGLSARTIQTSR